MAHPQEVVCLIGAHCSEVNRMQRTLLKNRFEQARRGVVIPEPKHYRHLINALEGKEKQAPKGFSWEDFPKLVGSERQLNRLVLTSEHFYCLPKNALKGGCYYTMATARIRALSNFFTSSEISLFFIVHAPSTFMPALLKKVVGGRLLNLTDGIDPRSYRWSELFSRLSHSHPALKFRVCCYEDLPFLWGQFAREMMDVPSNAGIDGSFDLVGDILTRAGMNRLHAFLDANSDLSELHKRRVTEVFLDKFSREDKLFEAVSVPGWTQEFVDELNEGYETDLDAIKALSNVSFMTV